MMLDVALPTFAITLREGVEAALVVGIVLTYLHKLGRSTLKGWVYWGVLAGVGISVMVGAGLIWLLHGLATSSQPVMTVVKPLVEAVITLVAILLLSWMLVWMTQQGKAMKTEVENAVHAALAENSQANAAIGWSLLILVAAAVLREGFETALFLAAQFQQGWGSVAGAIAGLLTASLLGVLLFRFGIRINLRRFFQVMGVTLLLIVAGLVIGLLKQVDSALLVLAQPPFSVVTICQNLSTTCILGPLLWDGSQILPDRQFPGVLLKALFGYRQRLYLVQIVAYVTFLTVVGGLYLQSLLGHPLGSLLTSTKLTSTRPSAESSD
ncbi:MAG: FTR1 family iron permease [Cyanobacteria bacterium]|nr:FTR1 family iron permease [Cyanobacteriota bacterium]MDW8200401.1 FTR1 family protein [Cyanobacteriota bacterium SKYGB_h_bin112]